MLAAAERRVGAMPSVVQPKALPVLPISPGPGGLTKKRREEEQRQILRRAEEERAEREMFAEAGRASAARAREEKQAAFPVTRGMTVQIRHDRGTEAVDVTEDMTFETLLVDLRDRLLLGENDEYTFRTNFPARKFGAEEQSLLVAESVRPPAVIILERQCVAPEPVVPTDPIAAPVAEAEMPAPPPPTLNSGRAAALAAAERRMQSNHVSPPTIASVPPPISPAAAPISPAVSASSALPPSPGSVGLNEQARIQRLKELKDERDRKTSERNRILAEADADRAFRAARKAIPVTITGAYSASSASSEPHASSASRTEPFLRVRDPSGAMHLIPYASPDMTLVDALTCVNIEPDAEALVALIPFPRRRLVPEEWSAALRTMDLFPHGTVLLVRAEMEGEQLSGGQATVWDPFGPEGISEAFPPPIRDRIELEARLQRLTECGATAQDVEDGRCGICLCSLQLDERLAKLPCSHRFHWDCMERSLRYTVACPCCRKNV